MGVEPTQDGITAPQTVLKTAPATGPGVAPSNHVRQSTKDMPSWLTRPDAPATGIDSIGSTRRLAGAPTC
jgi:hypothetical protein